MTPNEPSLHGLTARRNSGPRESDRSWTVPNVLSGIRLLFSPVLVVLAAAEMPIGCLVLFLILLTTDWIDGVLARVLKQATTLGARLDSYADATFYASVLLSVCWLKWESVRPEIIWVSLVVTSYSLNVLASWMKFRRFPTYHTTLAKTTWLFVAIAVVVTLGDGTIWALRVATIVGTITNLEETLITFALLRWRVNVPSVYHARRDRDLPSANDSTD